MSFALRDRPACGKMAGKGQKEGIDEGNKLGVPDTSLWCSCYHHVRALARQFYLMQKAGKAASEGVVKEGLIERGHPSRHRQVTGLRRKRGVRGGDRAQNRTDHA